MPVSAMQREIAKWSGRAGVDRVDTDIPQVVCRRTETALEIDAVDLEPAWAQAAVLTMRVNNGPNQGRRPPVGTWIQTLYDDDSLYFIFYCQDDRVVVDYHQHDDPMWNSNAGLELVELMLDPRGDGRSYCEINTNPDGVVLDVMITWVKDGPTFDVKWDAVGLKTAGRRLSVDEDGIDGWAVEVALPWAALQQNVPGPSDAWRMNIYRGDGEFEDKFFSWSPTLKSTFHAPQRFGTLVFE